MHEQPVLRFSALLVCLGLWVSFGSQVDASQTWSLLLGMAGYTLLLAVTACLLVRYVGVWDDVRTVMLLVVLMFLATSVTFDAVLAHDPMRGVACYLGGLLFAAAVSEGMLRGVRLRLPLLFRVPYYFVLTLFFIYPVALTPLVARPRSEELSWALFGFSPAAALVFFTLLPAIRRGRDYVHDNGSPWRWAWYPWTLFGVLAFAVPRGRRFCAGRCTTYRPPVASLTSSALISSFRSDLQSPWYYSRSGWWNDSGALPSVRSSCP